MDHDTLHSYSYIQVLNTDRQYRYPYCCNPRNIDLAISPISPSKLTSNACTKIFEVSRVRNCPDMSHVWV